MLNTQYEYHEADAGFHGNGFFNQARFQGRAPVYHQAPNDIDVTMQNPQHQHDPFDDQLHGRGHQPWNHGGLNFGAHHNPMNNINDRLEALNRRRFP